MTAGQPTRRQFAQTQWSTVIHLGSEPPADAQAALADTIASADEMLAERQALFAVLRGVP
jgi:hypothetical protein